VSKKKGRRKITLEITLWFLPIILATQRAEIGRITVQDQAGKKFVRPHFSQ
jgi:hypothetical protein